jgi:hypothetical protein
MNRQEIEKIVFSCIQRVASQQSISLKPLGLQDKIVDDLDFKSLDVGTLAAFLEIEFDFDPFAMGAAVITEIRTIDDICSLYDRCLNGGGVASNTPLQDESDRLKRRLKR